MDSNAETIISLHPGESVMFSPQPGHSIQPTKKEKRLLLVKMISCLIKNMHSNKNSHVPSNAKRNNFDSR